VLGEKAVRRVGAELVERLGFPVVTGVLELLALGAFGVRLLRRGVHVVLLFLRRFEQRRVAPDSDEDVHDLLAEPSETPELPQRVLDGARFAVCVDVEPVERQRGGAKHLPCFGPLHLRAQALLEPVERRDQVAAGVAVGRLLRDVVEEGLVLRDLRGGQLSRARGAEPLHLLLELRVRRQVERDQFAHRVLPFPVKGVGFRFHVSFLSSLLAALSTAGACSDVAIQDEPPRTRARLVAVSRARVRRRGRRVPESTSGIAPCL
jgi:hypothetical protein